MQLVDLDSPCRGGERWRTYDGGQAVVEAAATKNGGCGEERSSLYSRVRKV
jgi:hypothetical protein